MVLGAVDPNGELSVPKGLIPVDKLPKTLPEEPPNMLVVLVAEVATLAGVVVGFGWFSLSSTGNGLLMTTLDGAVIDVVVGLDSDADAAAIPFGSNAFRVGVNGFG